MNKEGRTDAMMAVMSIDQSEIEVALDTAYTMCSMLR